MLSRGTTSARLAILLLIAGLGVATLHMHPVERSARENSCSACVLAGSTLLAPLPAVIAPPALGESVTAHDAIRDGGARTGEPYPTRGPPSQT
jgi:hypothetical protein